MLSFYLNAIPTVDVIPKISIATFVRLENIFSDPGLPYSLQHVHNFESYIINTKINGIDDSNDWRFNM